MVRNSLQLHVWCVHAPRSATKYCNHRDKIAEKILMRIAPVKKTTNIMHALSSRNVGSSLEIRDCVHLLTPSDNMFKKIFE